MTNKELNDFFVVEANDVEVISETKEKMNKILTGEFVEQEYLNKYIGDLNISELLKLQSEIKSLLHTAELEISKRIKNGQYNEKLDNLKDFDPVTL